MFKQSLLQQGDDVEPLTLSRGPFDWETYLRSPMHLEWAKPQGIKDATNALVLMSSGRLGSRALITSYEQ
ncbi:MAG TPA: hypothetical protein PK264_14260 [Hyphomicrobiaceae bacterium]|nr:hypothetical protein [Hyphomicrobiaceae bacterium]